MLKGYNFKRGQICKIEYTEEDVNKHIESGLLWKEWKFYTEVEVLEDKYVPVEDEDKVKISVANIETGEIEKVTANKIYGAESVGGIPYNREAVKKTIETLRNEYK